MTLRFAPTPPDHWLDLIFSAQAVAKGGVVRRCIHWVDREVGRDRLEQEVRRRGFHLVQSGDQLLIICNQQGLRIIC